MSKLKKAQIIKLLESVEDPELHRSIVELGMVRDIKIPKKGSDKGGAKSGGELEILIALTTPGCPLKAEINDRVSNALKTLEGVEQVKVEFTYMSEEELQALRQKLQPASSASNNSSPQNSSANSGQGDSASSGHNHGHSHAQPEQPSAKTVPFSDLDSKTRCLLIASGKGGVGKSSVSVNAAVALASMGKSVALLDADVWGFSIPRMLGITQKPVVLDNMLLPPEAYGVRCISTGFFAEEGQPVIWRGPMLHKALHQFLADVFWDDPDFLVVDLPPGTGDISISLSQFLPRGEVYIVTTPQLVSQKVAQRAGAMAEKVNLEVKAVIENMSWFTGEDGKQYEIFGSGGGQELAELLSVPLIGQIPLVSDLRKGGDEGIPITVSDPESEAAQAFFALAQKLAVDMAPTRIYKSELKVN